MYYTTRFNYQNAMPTPWGKADSKHKITDGVYDVATPRHGGILVGKAVAQKLLSPKAIAIGMDWNNYYAFEEDCDWAVFAYEQPELYAASFKTHAINPDRITPDYVRNVARVTLESYYPQYFA